MLPLHLLVSVGLLASIGVAQSHVAFLAGEREYGSERSVPEFAARCEAELGVRTTVSIGRGRAMPELGALDDADLLVLFLRFREPSAAQRKRLNAWFEAGKPAIALRTTSHTMWNEKGWFPPIFGGHYKSHADNEDGTLVGVAAGAAGHPILRGVESTFEVDSGTYNAQPLAEGAVPLLFGRTGPLPAEPVAWTYSPRPGQRLFYTSLGAEDNFEDESFHRLLTNAIQWGLGSDRWSAPTSVVPDPPPLRAPANATVLFDGGDTSAWQHWDPSVEPRAIDIDERADTSSGGPSYDAARWTVDGRALVARPGFGDVLTREAFADYHLHLDFLLPRESTSDAFRGRSGVYLGGRYEVEIADSRGLPLGERSCGAVFDAFAPLVDAARAAGEWQSLDVAWQHAVGEPPVLSVWLDDRLVQHRVRPEEATVQGFLQPLPGEAPPSAARFTAPGDGFAFDEFGVAVRFRTEAGGTLVSKSPPSGPWAPNGKTLFVRDGRLVYDIGWVGAMVTDQRVDDGDWHSTVLTYRDGGAFLYLDGELVERRRGFTAEDVEEHVFKVGATSPDFGGDYDGDIDLVRWFPRSLTDDESRALSYGGRVDIEPSFMWTAADAVEPEIPAGGVVPGPIRLQADSSAVRFANVWVAPLDEVDHATVISRWDDRSFRRGRRTYRAMCITCHGADGKLTPLADARAFAVHPFVNGAAPHQIYRTLTEGLKTMPPQVWMTPEQRYDVIHYLREEFLKASNPSQYPTVDAAYLASLPKGKVPDAIKTSKTGDRDFGPALASQLGGRVSSALTIDLGENVTISYDLHELSVAGVWHGGFLDLRETQHLLQRGEGRATRDGEAIANLGGWRWGFAGSFDHPQAKQAPRSPLPREWLHYRGHHVHGRDVVLSYAIEGRGVLEVPMAHRFAEALTIYHHLRIESGEQPLLLSVARLPDAECNAIGRAMVARRGERAVALGLQGGDGLRLEELGDGRIGLRIPAGTEPLEFTIARFGQTGEVDRELLATHVVQPYVERPDLVAMTRGGTPLWKREVVTEGVVSEETDAYVLDTLTLPVRNPWNAWLRTSALDCFDDGRVAVSTYGGDVWIVSGVDDDLDELRWRRFASGMFEPMGLRIVDGVIHVTCRDRITRLHDRNGDGEADFYESFFADPDVSSTFHAFNFDLQTDSAGNLYYAKSGRYTDFPMPGAVVKVTPDGQQHEFFCTGFRTPNGMGMAPGDRVFVSDNQGNWIPASKISTVERGGFYGLFKTGRKEREDFDQPILWLPQELDSSSGGQLWVDDERFGPLSGRLFHTSFGKGWLYPIAMQSVDGMTQAAAWRLPFQFAAGIQRARVNPVDGQVYAVGLSGWQGPAGGDDGCLQRVRYTGAPMYGLLDTEVRRDGIALTFSCELDPAVAEERTRYRARRWQYRWTRDYGSPKFSLESGRRGVDEVAISGVELSADRRTVLLRMPDLRPVHQLQVDWELRTRDGHRLESSVYWTIHRVPE